MSRSGLPEWEWRAALDTSNREWIDNVLHLANMPERLILPTSAAEARRDVIVRERTEIRSYLDQLVSARTKKAREAVVAKLVDATIGLDGIPVVAAIRVGQNGATAELHAKPNFVSTLQWFAAALVALRQDGRGDRIRRCPECKREVEKKKCGGADMYFIDWPRKGGTRRVYCSSKHENRAQKRRNRPRLKP